MKKSGIMSAEAKGHLLEAERWPFGVQYATFHDAKGGILHAFIKRPENQEVESIKTKGGINILKKTKKEYGELSIMVARMRPVRPQGKS